jgi:hypothetical protein
LHELDLHANTAVYFNLIISQNISTNFSHVELLKIKIK